MYVIIHTIFIDILLSDLNENIMLIIKYNTIGIRVIIFVKNKSEIKYNVNTVGIICLILILSTFRLKTNGLYLP